LKAQAKSLAAGVFHWNVPETQVPSQSRNFVVVTANDLKNEMDRKKQIEHASSGSQAHYGSSLLSDVLKTGEETAL
jgi:hypothetical protein